MKRAVHAFGRVGQVSSSRRLGSSRRWTPASGRCSLLAWSSLAIALAAAVLVTRTERAGLAAAFGGVALAGAVLELARTFGSSARPRPATPAPGTASARAEEAQAVWEIDGRGRISWVNDEAVALLGGDRELIGVAIGEVLPGSERLWGSADAPARVEIRCPRPDGSDLVLELTCEPLTGGRARLVAEDRSEIRRWEGRLIHEATHDPLTGVLNRHGLFALAERATARAERSASGVAFILVDIDGFSRINDLMGGEVADAVLVAVAERLVGLARAGADRVARVGDDEFAVMVPAVRRVEDALAVANRIEQAMSEPVVTDGEVVAITVSCGVAWSSGRRHVPHEILRRADAALARAKAAGGRRVTVLDENLEREFDEVNMLERQLHHAVRTGELRAWGQTVVTLADGRPAALELLARWPRPDGFVDTATFIAIAERTGLVNEIGRQMLAAAARLTARWASDPQLGR
ncbi:MAG: diguanylate cyclase, partial [Acidimicrobiia bacterium]|nr:diguanylate cyclase [Acidimicrobiia bacterium]